MGEEIFNKRVHKLTLWLMVWFCVIAMLAMYAVMVRAQRIAQEAHAGPCPAAPRIEGQRQMEASNVQR